MAQMSLGNIRNPLYRRGLQLIRLSGDRAVVKSGVQEIFLEGAGVASEMESLLGLLDGTRTAEEILNSFAATEREHVQSLLTALVQRGLIFDEPNVPDGHSNGDALQLSFYASFGPGAGEARARVRAANVLIAGANVIARTIATSLVEAGIGSVARVNHPVLDNHLVDVPDVGGDEAIAARDSAHGTPAIRLLTDLPSGPELGEFSLIVAASDLGEVDALVDINRVAISAGKPFLPVWLADMIGYVGPLHYPFETACFNCYRLRADSNNPRYEITRAVRRHVSGNSSARTGAGFLPPMPGIAGQIAAMEILKAIGQIIPGDAVGAVIEINLVSFHSAVRRVLKVPRCPECSDLMRTAAPSLNLGPKIPVGNG